MEQYPQLHANFISFQLNTIKFLCTTIKLPFVVAVVVVVLVVCSGLSEYCFVVGIDFQPRPSLP